MTERVAGADRRVERQGRRRGVMGWVDVRGRRLGGWAFILNRLTGLGVLFYLYLHLIVLSQLAVGPSAWDSLLRNWFLNPVFLLLDVVLLAGLVIHGLNGVRLALVGFGIVIDRQKALLLAFGVLGAILIVIGALRFISDAGAK